MRNRLSRGGDTDGATDATLARSAAGQRETLATGGGPALPDTLDLASLGRLVLTETARRTAAAIGRPCTTVGGAGGRA